MRRSSPCSRAWKTKDRLLALARGWPCSRKDKTEMDAETSSTKISPEVREKMVRNFAAWLDRALEEETLPEGLPPGLLTALQNGEPLPSLEGTPSAGQGSDLFS